jgi:hypothetical protein
MGKVFPCRATKFSHGGQIMTEAGFHFNGQTPSHKRHSKKNALDFLLLPSALKLLENNG